MISKSHHMSNTLDAVDPMVLSLRSEVEKVMSDNTRFRFEVCIAEALTNLVIHTQEKASGNPIEINMTLQPELISIEIFDPIGAVPFDLRSNAKDLSDEELMAEGGRGIGLIIEMADQVHYGPVGGKNRLRLDFEETQETPNSSSTHGEMR